MNATKRPLLAITMGDAAGIGPEILERLVQAGGREAQLLLIGAPRCTNTPGVPEVDSPEALKKSGAAYAWWTGAAPLPSRPTPGTIDAASGAASHAWVVAAAELALAGRIHGIVTGPIHKEAWHAAGVAEPGHTEVLLRLAGVPRVLMMLVGGTLKTALATIHVPLRQVPELLDTSGLTEQIQLLSDSVAADFGPDRPRLAVCGLNPHAGEGGLFGTEDAAIIAPAVQRAREAGVDAIGPLPADACIPAAAQGAYDAVLAMYHDQALPAVKTLGQREGVNITLGLPIIRTSVDHGTAFDIAGRGIAEASSLAAAVTLATRIANRHVATARTNAPQTQAPTGLH